jgi:hypothetical protein
MEETMKELTEGQMENVTGGGIVPGGTNGTNQFKDKSGSPLRMDKSPHCKACGREVASVSGMYRCKTPGCSECGKNKTVSEVDWK